jgi:hypothetical protein
MAAATKETTELTFRALGEDGTLPESFQLVKITRLFRADARTSGGWALERITGQEVVADAVGWLAYTGNH